MTYFFSVEWDAKGLPWTKFNKELVGEAAQGNPFAESLVASIRSKWEELGMHKQPSPYHQLIHGSQSPLVGMSQRVNWLDFNIEEDYFSRLIQATGWKVSMIKLLCFDPEIKHKGRGTKMPISEHVVGMDARSCLKYLEAVKDIVLEKVAAAGPKSVWGHSQWRNTSMQQRPKRFQPGGGTGDNPEKKGLGTSLKKRVDDIDGSFIHDRVNHELSFTPNKSPSDEAVSTGIPEKVAAGTAVPNSASHALSQTACGKDGKAGAGKAKSSTKRVTANKNSNATGLPTKAGRREKRMRRGTDAKPAAAHDEGASNVIAIDFSDPELPQNGATATATNKSANLMIKHLQSAGRIKGLKECVAHLLLAEDGLQLSELEDLIKTYVPGMGGNDAAKAVEALKGTVVPTATGKRYRLQLDKSLDVESREIVDDYLHPSAAHRWITANAHYVYFLKLKKDPGKEHRHAEELANLNRFVDWGVLSKPKIVARCTALDFSDAKLLDEDVRILCAQLMKNTSVLSLNIGSNRLKSPGANAVAELLKENTPLQELIMSTNEIGDGGANELAGGFFGNSTLLTLGLKSNGISAEGCVALCDALHNNRSLSQLDLGSNTIHEEGIEAILRLLRVNSCIVEIGIEGIKGMDKTQQTVIKNFTEINQDAYLSGSSKHSKKGILLSAMSGGPSIASGAGGSLQFN